eukprot:scaffold303576_cov37-Tisochrysis_lutea.AAC.1
MGKGHSNAKQQQDGNKTGPPEGEVSTLKETTRERLPPTARDDEITTAPRERVGQTGQRARRLNTMNTPRNQDQQRVTTPKQHWEEAPIESPHQARQAPTRHSC